MKNKESKVWKAIFTNFICYLLCLLIFLGCKSNGGKSETVPFITGSDISGKHSSKVLSDEPYLLNMLIRRLGEQYPVSVAVMNGLESRWIQIDKPEKEISKLMEQIIIAGRLNCQFIHGYYFLFPLEQPFYESLTRLSISSYMPKKYWDLTVTASFGTGLELFNVFNSLNYAYGCNVVGDNTIAEIPVGEVVIHNLPLALSIELILKSARIDPNSIRFCATEEFIFLFTLKNEHAKDLENCKGFTFDIHENDKIVTRRVSLYLPQPVHKDKTSNLPFYQGAKSLETVASSIANQLGLIVEIEPQAEKIPINPCYLNNLPLKTVLDLIKYQWLDRKYRYKIEDNKVIFHYETELQ